MPLIAQDIVDLAREADPLFTPERHTLTAALKALARIHRRLAGQLAKVDRTQLQSTTLEITLPLPVFADGAALEDPPGTALEIQMIHRPLDLFVTNEVLPRRLDLIDWSDRHRVRRRRFAWAQGATLYLSGEEELWTDATKVVLTYTPTPETLAKIDPLVLPLTAEDAAADHLSAWMANRARETELAKPRAEFRAVALASEASWLDDVRRRRGATVSQRREVW